MSATEEKKSSGPKFVSQLKERLHIYSEKWAKFSRELKYSSLKRKFSFLGLILLFIVTVVILVRISTKGLIPPSEELFITSLAELAQEKYQFEPGVDTETFYDSTRTTQHILLLRKMVVNIKASKDSGPNPMAMIELFIEGTDGEVLVEIKDREFEIMDLFQRKIEELNYDQLVSVLGKRSLCSQLGQELNHVLTKGLVKRVFIKNIVIKP